MTVCVYLFTHVIFPNPPPPKKKKKIKGIVNRQNKGVPRMQQSPLDISQWHISPNPQYQQV